MTFFAADARDARASRIPHFDPAWMFLGAYFAILLSALVWSDHVVDTSLEDWHGNVKRSTPQAQF